MKKVHGVSLIADPGTVGDLLAYWVLKSDCTTKCLGIKRKSRENIFFTFYYCLMAGSQILITNRIESSRGQDYNYEKY